MNRAWIVCAALAIGTHALLLFAIHPGTLAQPHVLADESSAVELSIVESAPAAAEPPPVPVPLLPPPPEPAPSPPEPVPEPVREPTPEPTVIKPTPLPRPRSEVPKPRVAAPQRTASALATPSSGSIAGPATGRGPSTSARPRYRSNPKPDYPPEARRAGQQGVVMLTAEVTAEGRAASVQLSRSSGFPLLDAAALQAVRRWTFEPARTVGIPTASRVEVPVRFDLSR